MQYRLEQRPRELGDFEATCWYHRTSPNSPFRRSLVCSRLLAAGGGRVTLSGHTLILTDGQGQRTGRELEPPQVLPAYAEHFGIVLDREPAVAPLP